ncbi:hypothetical protein BK816_01645 [Boudabousia tangfeifanii]|uniref:N-acetyltransferase domain-containing protein n=1 Tax=Boudabousia tangfeifanii TaxID=1912795 RepID=A0A1D9MMM9_9ACTO|nr:hypothetical protein BK816_01645 [Boudabousia tangfeifanii]
MLVRQARLEDAPGVAGVHLAAWQEAYRGLLPDELLDARTLAGQTAKWELAIGRTLGQEWRSGGAPVPWDEFLVAEVSGRVVGWIVVGSPRDLVGESLGELKGIYVHPEFFGAGVGRLLLARGEEALLRHGCVEAFLWVLAGNERAAGFYRAHGWCPAEVDGVKEALIDGFVAVERRLVKSLIQ